MICKNTLDKLGKAAFNSLSDDDKIKYTTASTVVDLIKDLATSGNITLALPNVGLTLAKVGVKIGSEALIQLADSVGQNENKTLSSALNTLSTHLINSVAELVDQVLHDFAAKLAVLFGIDENPGIIGAILEWVYRSLIKPVVAIG